MGLTEWLALFLTSYHRSPEGVVFGEAALPEDALMLHFESLVCFDVIGIEVLDVAEQGVEALGGLKRGSSASTPHRGTTSWGYPTRSGQRRMPSPTGPRGM